MAFCDLWLRISVEVVGHGPCGLRPVRAWWVTQHRRGDTRMRPQLSKCIAVTADARVLVPRLRTVRRVYPVHQLLARRRPRHALRLSRTGAAGGGRHRCRRLRCSAGNAEDSRTMRPCPPTPRRRQVRRSSWHREGGILFERPRAMHRSAPRTGSQVPDTPVTVSRARATPHLRPRRARLSWTRWRGQAGMRCRFLPAVLESVKMQVPVLKGPNSPISSLITRSLSA